MHTQARQPQGSQPGLAVHPQEQAPGQHLSTAPTPGEQTAPLARGPRGKAGSLGRGLGGLHPFSLPPLNSYSFIFLNEQKMGFFFSSFLYSHKERRRCQPATPHSMHKKRVPGTSVPLCCKKGTFSAADSPTSLSKGEAVAMRLRAGGKRRGREKAWMDPHHLTLPGSHHG